MVRFSQTKLILGCFVDYIIFTKAHMLLIHFLFIYLFQYLSVHLFFLFKGLIFIVNINTFYATPKFF